MKKQSIKTQPAFNRQCTRIFQDFKSLAVDKRKHDSLSTSPKSLAKSIFPLKASECGGVNSERRKRSVS